MTARTPATKDVRDAYMSNQGLKDRSGPEFDRWLAEVERAAAEKALLEAAEEIDTAEDRQQFKNPTEAAPLGWTDESIADALDTSGVITDWLRNRAEMYRREEA